MSSLKANITYNIAYQILNILLPLVTAPYVSRVLGADGVGTYSYMYSIAYYFGLVGMLGITNHGSRSIALHKTNKEELSQIFSNIYAIQVISTSLAILAYIIFIIFVCDDKLIGAINVLFVVSYFLDINWLFFGLEKFKVTVTRNTLIKLCTVMCIFMFVKKESDIWLYTLIMSLGACLSQLYLWTQFKKYARLKRPQLEQFKQNIKPILMLFIPSIAYSVYKVLDKIMLGNMSTMIQVGYFENAERVVNIPVSFITAFGTVMLPRISSLIADQDNEQILRYNILSFKYFTILLCASVFGLMGVSDILAPVYFGNEFTECAPIICGLSISLIPMIWANIIRTQYLIPHGQDKPYVISTICGAVANICINYTLIPLFGAKGTMLGTIVAEFVVFFVQALYVGGAFPILKFMKQTIIFFPIGMLTGSIVWEIGNILGSNVTTLMIQLLCGGIIYSSFVAICLFVTKDALFMSIVNKFIRFLK